MRDIRKQLGAVWRTANRLDAQAQGGRSLMVVAATQGEGVTTVAANLALIASRRADKAVWLVDLDVRRNAVYKSFKQASMQGMGAPGRAYDASLREQPPYRITPSVIQNEDQKLLSVHKIQGTQLYITRFRNEYLRGGQRVQICSAAKWWRALRQIADWTLVDAPALDRSSAALAVASQMDGIIMVVEADRTSAQEVADARREIEDHGGTVIGIVMNCVGADARLVNRFVR